MFSYKYYILNHTRVLILPRVRSFWKVVSLLGSLVFWFRKISEFCFTSAYLNKRKRLRQEMLPTCWISTGAYLARFKKSGSSSYISKLSVNEDSKLPNGKRLGLCATMVVYDFECFWIIWSWRLPSLARTVPRFGLFNQ